MLRSFLNNLYALFFPRLCYACNAQPLPNKQKFLCPICDYSIKSNQFHSLKDNPVVDKFPLENRLIFASTGFVFIKNGIIQTLIHQLKYEARPEIGFELGKRCGQALIKHLDYIKVDAIVPVPMHPKKQRERGYNQAEMFAMGIAESIPAPIASDWVTKRTNTISQTKMNRSERMNNVKDTFYIGDSDRLKDKHLLLVDDVITTGATLEALMNTLKEIDGVRFSIVAIALAN